MLGNTLLIIDDDALWTKATAAYFAALGYGIHTAGNGKDGLRLIETLKPDYVIVDFYLGDCDAAGICAHIRGKAELKHTCVVVASGRAAIIDIAYDECMADHFVLKGTTNATIHNILRGFRRRVNLERGIVEKGDLCLKRKDFQVCLNSEPVARLSADRFALLSLLVEVSPACLDESAIAARLYNCAHPEEKAAGVRVLLHRLKRDLGPLAARIRNRRGEGWAYIPPAAGEPV